METESFLVRSKTTVLAIAIGLVTVLAATGIVRAGAPGDLTDAEFDQAWVLVDQITSAHNAIWETGEIPELGPELQAVSDSSPAFRTELLAEINAVLNRRKQYLNDGLSVKSTNTNMDYVDLSRAANGGVRIDATISWWGEFSDSRLLEDDKEFNKEATYLIVLPPEATGSKARPKNSDAEDSHIQIQRVTDFEDL